MVLRTEIILSHVEGPEVAFFSVKGISLSLITT